MKKLKKLKKLSLTIGTGALSISGLGIAVSAVTVNNDKTLSSTNNSTSNMLGVSANQSIFDSSKVNVSLVKQQYAWKRATFKRKKGIVSELDTSINKFEDKQKRHWDVKKQQTNTDNSMAQYHLCQRSTATNNVRAILMQYEIAYEVPANSTIEANIDARVAGTLSIHGLNPELRGRPGCAAVEVGFSNVSDSPEINLSVGNVWNDLNVADGDQLGEDHNIYHQFNDNKKHLSMWREEREEKNRYYHKFDNRDRQNIIFNNESNEPKVIKKYLSLYVLSSSWKNHDNQYHRIDNAYATIKVSNSNQAEIVATNHTHHSYIDKINESETTDKYLTNSKISREQIVNSKQITHHEWEISDDSYNLVDNRSYKFHKNFRTINPTKNYEKALYWTNAVKVKVPAKSKVTVSIDDIKYHLRAGIKSGCSFLNCGLYGIGISQFYQDKDSSPISYIGDENISWDSKANNYCYKQTNGDKSSSGGVLFTLATEGKAIGWKYISAKENSKMNGSGDASLNNENRTFTITNEKDKSIVKTIYFDSWVICAHQGTDSGSGKKYPVKLCGDSFLEYVIKLS